MISLFVALGVSLCVPLFVGIYYYSRQSTQEFIDANRSLATMQGSFSIVSVLGGVVLIGQASLGFELGIHALWLFVGMACFLCLLSLLAPRINTQSKQYNALTLGELITHNTGVINGKLASVALFIIFFAILVGNIVIGASILATMLHIALYQAALLLAAIVMIYLWLGGFLVVVKTDYIQFLCMFFIGLLLLFFLDLSSLDLKNFVMTADPTVIMGFFAPGLVIFASADIIQRITTAKTPTIAKHMTLLSAPLLLFLGVIFTGIGMMAVGVTDDAAQAFLVSMSDVFPAWLSPFALIMLLAAIMSTIDTELFYLSTSIVRDFIPSTMISGIIKNGDKKNNYKSNDKANKKTTFYLRIIMLGVLLLSIVIAIRSPSIVDLLFVALNIGTALGLPVLYMFLMQGGKYGVGLGQLAGYIYFAYHFISGYDPLIAANYIAGASLIGIIIGFFFDSLANLTK